MLGRRVIEQNTDRKLVIPREAWDEVKFFGFCPVIPCKYCHCAIVEHRRNDEKHGELQGELKQERDTTLTEPCELKVAVTGAEEVIRVRNRLITALASLVDLRRHKVTVKNFVRLIRPTMKIGFVPIETLLTTLLLLSESPDEVEINGFLLLWISRKLLCESCHI